MRPARVVLLLVIVATGLAAAQETAPAPSGLFPLVAMHSRISLDQADPAAYPSVDAQYAANGVTQTLDVLYRSQMAATGCNAIAVEVAIPCEVEATANRLANLCTWADSLGAAAPSMLISLAQMHAAPDMGAAHSNTPGAR